MAAVFKFPGLEVDIARHEVLVSGRMVDLTAKEFNLLHFLIKNNGIVFDRRQLLKSVWGKEPNCKSRTIDVHIRRIRRRLGEASHYLLTLRGVGYKFRANGITSERKGGDMIREKGCNGDYVAGILRSQISVSQNMLYCLENNTLDQEYLKEGLKMLGKYYRQIGNMCDQPHRSSDSELAVVG